MDKETAINTVWDYMHMQHELVPADLIFVLGSIDARVADHAAMLFQQGLAPTIAISGDGTKHESTYLKNAHAGKKEAEVLAERCLAAGVPEEKIILETTANNTGQNYEFTTPLIKAAGINLQTCIVVQKPYMERRAYATGKIWWPDVDLRMASPSGTFAEYVNGAFAPDDIINIMVGDLERIREYPSRGFQIEQDIPAEVAEAFQALVNLGYIEHLSEDLYPR